MDLFNREELEKLANIKNDICISIYINTHKSGQEANDRTDVISLKNELLKIKSTLEDQGYQEKEVENILQPAYQLLEDVFFWKNQSDGLAIFMHPQFFKTYRVPISFKSSSFISKEFIFNQLIPLLSGNGEFFLLALSQEDTKFFKADMFGMEEITHEAKVPTTIDSTLKYYEFKREWQKGTGGHVINRTSSASPSGSPGTVMFHGHGADTESFNAYIFEYLRYLNNKIINTLNKYDIPLVIAGVDKLLPIYEKANTYHKLINESVRGNYERDLDKLYEQARNIMKPYFDKPLKKQLEKYNAFAGTGKTSYELEDIYKSAKAGRIETLFLEEGVNIWGQLENDKLQIHNNIGPSSSELTNECAVETIKNNGDVYILPKEKLPDPNRDKSTYAIYRY
ncbi:MAG: hypothetical protein ACK4ND_05580 [Cytophagaceae bacterium]